MQRPLITNNIHGCMEAVEEGYNGFLATLKDKENLYYTIRRFVDLPYEEKKLMGINSRMFVQKHFEKKMVVEKTINEIFEKEKKLLGGVI